MNGKRIAFLCASILSMVLLILDAETAFLSASDGIDICIRTVIPSLFPFFFLSAIINNALTGLSLPAFRPIRRLCRLQEGTESLLLLGMIGGYPIGASGIRNAFASGCISEEQARRMLAFCNNAGPSFIFGMVSVLFENKAAAWALWGIQLLSAICVAVLLPGGMGETCKMKKAEPLTAAKALRLSIRNISVVCGWVVLFRIVYGFCNRWFLWLFPKPIQVLFCGFSELANGCVSLSEIASPGLRFIFAAVFLAFGGMCVGMQTASVIGELSIKSYWKGKMMQTLLCLLFADISQYALFPGEAFPLPVSFCVPGILLLFLPVLKKAAAFPKIMGYNRKNSLG